MNRFRKASPAVLGILAIFLGAWTFAPRSIGAAQTGQAQVTPAPTSRPLSFPAGTSANQKALIQSIYDFNPDISSITAGSLVGSERTALDVMWAQNYNVLQMLRVAMNRARNPQLREQVRLLYQMRLKDQQLLNQLEAQVAPAATPTAAATTTETAAATTVVTETATLPVTETATVAPTESATAVVTESPTAAPTESGTAVSTGIPTPEATVTGTVVSTGIPTPEATMTGTLAATLTGAPTAEPTTEATAGATSTAEANVIPGMGSGGRPVSLSAVPILPGTALGQLGFHTVDLNSVFLNKITHVSNNQFDAAFVVQMNAALNLAQDTAQVVQSTSTNSVLQAVAKHLAQEDALHLLQLQVLADRVFFDQGLIVHFPSAPGAPGQPTPAATESATPAAPSGTETPAGQSQPFEVH